MPITRDTLRDNGFVLNRKDTNDPTRIFETPQSTNVQIPLSSIPLAIPNGALDLSKLNLSRLNPNENVGTSNFVTGVSGWRIYGAGNVEFNDGVFRGALTAATIDIGGSDASSFHVDINGNMWLGAATFATATFSVSNAGSMIATDGQIATWYINATTLSSGAVEATSNVLIDSANSLIRLGPTSGSYVTIDGANQRIRSSNYSAGAAGFTVGPDLIEAGNFRARGSMKMANFEKNTISSIGGAIQLNKGSDTLAVDMTALDSSTLEIRGTETFAVGDFLEIKEGTDDEWFEVTSIAAAPIYTVTRDKAGTYSANNNPAWKKGATVVNYGASGQGFIAMQTAITNSPWMKIATHSGTPWSSTDTKVLIGQLKDKTGVDEYGIWIKSGAAYIAGYRLYEAVVDVNGLGDYTTIASAIAAGKKNIFVRKGTYIESMLTITSGISIVGENKYNTIIDFNSTTNYLKIEGDTAEYTTGTISITTATATVTGSGTSWLANASAGEYIRIGEDLYLIQSVDSNTSITLSSTYIGVTISGKTYGIAAYISDVVIQNLTVKNASGANSGIRILYAQRVVVENCITTNNGTAGVKMLFSSYNCKCTGVLSYGNTYGISVTGRHNVIESNICTANQGGIYVADDATSNIFYNNTCNSNSGDGFESPVGPSRISYNVFYANSCSYNVDDGMSLADTDGAANSFLNNFCSYNGGDGIYLTCPSSKVTNNNLVFNGANGLNLTSTGTGSSVVGNICSSNTIDGISMAGERCVASSNVCASNTADGIDIGGYSTASSNYLYSNGGYGLYDTGGYSMISDNYIYLNTSHGIYCTAANCYIQANHVYDNSGAGIYTTDKELTIQNNVCQANTSDGIYIDASSIIVEGNKSWDNGGDGIEINGAAKASILCNNNHCIGNGGQGILFDNNPTYTLVVGNRCGNFSGTAGVGSVFANNVNT